MCITQRFFSSNMVACIMDVVQLLTDLKKKKKKSSSNTSDTDLKFYIYAATTKYIPG